MLGRRGDDGDDDGERAIRRQGVLTLFPAARYSGAAGPRWAGAGGSGMDIPWARFLLALIPIRRIPGGTCSCSNNTLSPIDIDVDIVCKPKPTADVRHCSFEH